MSPASLCLSRRWSTRMRGKEASEYLREVHGIELSGATSRILEHEIEPDRLACLQDVDAGRTSHETSARMARIDVAGRPLGQVVDKGSARSGTHGRGFGQRVRSPVKFQDGRSRAWSAAG